MNTNDMSLDRSLKVMFTQKNSALYLLPISRKLTKIENDDIP